MIWNKNMECASREEMTALQSERLVKLVKYVYNNVEFYRKKMDAVGVKPEDIKGIEDITKLPFTTPSDFSQHLRRISCVSTHPRVLRVRLRS